MCTRGAYTTNCSFSPSPQLHKITKVISQQEVDILFSLLKMEQKYRRKKRANKVHDEHCQLGFLSTSVAQTNAIVPP